MAVAVALSYLFTQLVGVLQVNERGGEDDHAAHERVQLLLEIAHLVRAVVLCRGCSAGRVWAEANATDYRPPPTPPPPTARARRAGSNSSSALETDVAMVFTTALPRR